MTRILAILATLFVLAGQHLVRACDTIEYVAYPAAQIDEDMAALNAANGFAATEAFARLSRSDNPAVRVAAFQLGLKARENPVLLSSALLEFLMQKKSYRIELSPAGKLDKLGADFMKVTGGTIELINHCAIRSEGCIGLTPRKNCRAGYALMVTGTTVDIATVNVGAMTGALKLDESGQLNGFMRYAGRSTKIPATMSLIDE